jgi:mannose-6-phosphate isomerase-like protein (cupin superfamily)
VKIISKVQLLFCCSALLGAIAVQPGATLFENDDVKVVRALEKAHVKGKFHEHTSNRVMVYLQNGKQRFEYQDSRKPVAFDWKAGQVVWSPPEGMHSPEVTGDDPFNIIEVELKKPAAGKPAHDAARLDSKHFKVELENDQVRVLRVTLGAHQSAPVRDSHNRVAIFLTDTANHKAGDAAWETAADEKIDNPGDKPLEMVLVELRK